MWRSRTTLRVSAGGVKWNAGRSLYDIQPPNIAQNILTVDATLCLLTFSFGLSWWVINAIPERIRLNRWRRNIPLVIGGWGSRGKSGTERLKAAMIQGMGYSLFAKTTGCEAMMVARNSGSTPEGSFCTAPTTRPHHGTTHGA